ncbi:hypothetical protein [Fluviicola chungangensis]|uniref:Uncharacterized protein n=1 Tax=Fluviicola chungangensis TaxID=2597671 RepID=A0A556N665_9FLAO|nr:hypothetical protein [Fluviicola chungangensis]TSJ47591.1 hypothetical protein FO442_00240 [Fluviicola chungangensis]
MKISFLPATLLLVFFSSCQKNDDLIIQVRNVSFQTASTENEFHAAIPTTDSISAPHFILNVNWDIERTNDADYDPVETAVINENPVDSIKIWSDQSIAGRSPGSSLNTLFTQYYSFNVAAKPLTENGGLIYFSMFNSFDEPLRKVSFLQPTVQIESGTYDFYFRCVLRDGTVISNSLTHILIK